MTTPDEVVKECWIDGLVFEHLSNRFKYVELFSYQVEPDDARDEHEGTLPQTISVSREGSLDDDRLSDWLHARV